LSEARDGCSQFERNAFSKVSSRLNSICRMTIKLTFENLLQGYALETLVCSRLGCMTARHCNTLQRTATHCNTLQHTATHCNPLQHTATHLQGCALETLRCSRLEGMAKCWCAFRNALSSRCVAVCCSVVQCVAVCCSVLQCVAVLVRIPERAELEVCCSVLQCSAVCCNVLQCWCAFRNALSSRCVAVCCSVLQCVAVC